MPGPVSNYYVRVQVEYKMSLFSTKDKGRTHMAGVLFTAGGLRSLTADFTRRFLNTPQLVPQYSATG